jgi:hypothetical protein
MSRSCDVKIAQTFRLRVGRAHEDGSLADLVLRPEELGVAVGRTQRDDLLANHRAAGDRVQEMAVELQDVARIGEGTMGANNSRNRSDEKP